MKNKHLVIDLEYILDAETAQFKYDNIDKLKIYKELNHINSGFIVVDGIASIEKLALSERLEISTTVIMIGEMLGFEFGEFKYLDKKDIMIKLVENNYDKLKEAFNKIGIPFEPKTLDDVNMFFGTPEIAIEMVNQTFLDKEYNAVYNDNQFGDYLEVFVFSPKIEKRSRYDIDNKMVHYLK